MTSTRMRRLDLVERRLTERDNASHLGTVIMIERTSDDAPPEIDTGVVLRPGRPSIRLERRPDEPQEAFLNRCHATV